MAADSNPDTISLLRASLARWDEYLREIKEPDAVFQEQRNKISDRSKKRLEEFALNPPNDNISILQQALLSDAREIEKLELEHAATIARKQELQGETAEVVAGRILEDLIDILGLPVIQRLAPALLPPQEEQGATSKLVAGSDGLSAPDRPVAVVEEGPTPSKRYNTRSRRRLCQRTPAAANTPAAESEGALKRKRDTDVDTDSAREKKSTRTTPRQSSTRQPTPRQAPPSKEATYGSVGSPSPPSVTPNSLHHYSNEGKGTIQKPGATPQSKGIRFGINGQAARIMVHWDPVRGLWVCAVHIPQGQAIPNLDAMMRRSVVPAFIRLISRRQVANRLEHRGTASEDSQPSGGCHTSPSSGEEPNKNISKARRN
ncbi:hypothetical protein CEP54_016159 [Fusarium duplospermum]|uniref:Uncharacterized protein n=1 Tax=Fusarium duplospermum TaxID=1325734 RepID=A0A428NHK3_9HYPO|nr:hypothetical protein CEP54_016159 [Fusarium duplospermum]